MKKTLVFLVLTLILTTLTAAQTCFEENWNDGDWTNNSTWFEFENDQNFYINYQYGHEAVPSLMGLVWYCGPNDAGLYTPINCGDTFTGELWYRRGQGSRGGVKIGISDGAYSSSNRGFHFWLRPLEELWYFQIVDIDNTIIFSQEITNDFTWLESRWKNIYLTRSASGAWEIIWDYNGPDQVIANVQDSFVSLTDPNIWINPLTTDSMLCVPAGDFYIDDIVFTSEEPCPNGMIMGTVTEVPGNIAMENITVSLLDGDDNFISSTLTLSDGSYSFPNLTPGDYFVEIVVPPDYTVNHNHVEVTLACGETAIVDFELSTICYPAMIMGTVTVVPGNVGMENVTVSLLDGDDNFISSTLTLSDGSYSFPDLQPGDYFVEIVVPPDYSVNQNHVEVILACGVTAIVDFELSQGCPPGYIYGLVSELPSMNGMPNVTVDLLDGDSNLLDSFLTCQYGYYWFVDLEPGEYIIEITEPLGYNANQNYVSVTVECGETVVVNFVLTQAVICTQPRTIGFWKHQANGNGNPQYSFAEMLIFSQLIFDHFYSNPVYPIQIEFVTFVGSPAQPLAIADLQYILNINKNSSSMYERACMQLMATLLNVASDKLGQYSQASDDGANVSQALIYIDQILGIEDELAKDIAQTLNKDQLVDAGIIPLTTPYIIYGEDVEGAFTVSSYKFNQPSPNPFNPETNLKFELPEAGNVSLIVYDMQGREVVRLVDGWHPAGIHEAIFDGSALSSGVYFACLQVGAETQTRKVVLMK